MTYKGQCDLKNDNRDTLKSMIMLDCTPTTLEVLPMFNSYIVNSLKIIINYNSLYRPLSFMQRY